jgi:TonB family protein
MMNSPSQNFGTLVLLSLFSAACAAPLSSALATCPDGSSGVERCATDPLPPGVVPFHASMTPPNPILPPLPLTPEAIQANVSGRIHLSCIVTEEGDATQCVFRETVPYMSKAALAAVEKHRFEPAKIGGDPVTVEYDFIWHYPAKRPAPQPADNASEGPVYSNGWTRPVKIAGPDIQYTPEALAHRVHGIVVVRCVITAEGSAEDCQVIKTVPYMEEEIVRILKASRYRPALLDGVPQRIRYTFAIQLALPQKRRGQE